MEKLLRLIREQEPTRPSTRLSDPGAALAAISSKRQTEPAKLTWLVRGELDWIVMRSLEDHPNRRSETANGFAADVLRFLNDEPVLAHPPSSGDRLRKFVRCNRGPVVVGVVRVGSLVATVVGTSIGMARAIQAESAAARAADGEISRRRQAEHHRGHAVAAEALALDRLAEFWRRSRGPRHARTGPPRARRRALPDAHSHGPPGLDRPGDQTCPRGPGPRRVVTLGDPPEQG